MKKILVVVISIMCLNAQAQKTEIEKRIKGEKFSRNTFYVNILGSSIPASFNYERIITKNGVVNVAAKVGGFYFPFPAYNDLTLANGSFEINMLIGRKSHLFVMGLGWAGYYGSFYSDNSQKTRYYGIPTSTFGMHYRFQKPSHGVFFQVGFSSTTILAFASNDLTEMAIANAVIYGMDFIFGQKPTFTVPSIGIGYSF